ncbi:MAG: hypothetical protein Cons2KO_27700 [Congregibacter sp.]
MAVLDCRDTRITLWADGEGHHSPGFVLWDNNQYRFGEVAREQARLRPRDSNTRFWWQLGTQPLQPSLGPARHTADLVHAHLTEIHKTAGAPESLALAVPDSMPREQLSLLLGVAQACSFKVSGLISRSVLAASGSPLAQSAQRLLYVETQLNQTVVNELHVRDDRVAVTRSTPLPACGLLALQERCIVAIASAFIQQTRYDPRRAAASEQRLYNMLPDILREIAAKGEASVDVDGNRCRITASALANVCDRLLAGVNGARGSEDVPLLIDPELQILPGITALGAEVTAFGEGDLWRAWDQQRAHVQQESDDLHLIDKLPLGRSETERSETGLSETAAAVTTTTKAASPADSAPSSVAAPIAQSAQTSQKAATHVLMGTRAMPLKGEEITLGDGFKLVASQGAWSLQGDGGLVNGLPAAPSQILELGDTLSLGSAGHGRLIEVVD